ncbi:hypothetical protein MNV49_002390 [Pseudohyphozyma bogoriensis]|nr:hypothetical protein MNV49_002390 [Pseudohyphozyma bogoriensis]
MNDSLLDSLTSLSASFAALPANLTTTNLTLLSTLLSNFSSQVSGLNGTQLSNSTSSLIGNATWVQSNLAGLQTLIVELPDEVVNVNGSEHASLVGMVQLADFRPSTFGWTLDGWFLSMVLFVAVFAKVLRLALLRPAAVERVRQTGLRNEQALITTDSAACILDKPVRAALMSLCKASAWHEVQLSDITLLSTATKFVLASYGCELLLGDVGIDVYAHHLLTAGLMVLLQAAGFSLLNPKFFRMAQWALLPSTTEQISYIGLALYHYSTSIKIQDSKSFRGVLKLAWCMMSVTKRADKRARQFIEYPQKIVPMAISLYWMITTWLDVGNARPGSTWLGGVTALWVLLFLVQLKLCDDVVPLADHMKIELAGGQPPELPRGPLKRLITHQYGHHPHLVAEDPQERSALYHPETFESGMYSLPGEFAPGERPQEIPGYLPGGGAREEQYREEAREYELTAEMFGDHGYSEEFPSDKTALEDEYDYKPLILPEPAEVPTQAAPQQQRKWGFF